jgi:hypothetical protein
VRQIERKEARRARGERALEEECGEEEEEEEEERGRAKESERERRGRVFLLPSSTFSFVPYSAHLLDVDFIIRKDNAMNA